MTLTVTPEEIKRRYFGNTTQPQSQNVALASATQITPSLTPSAAYIFTESRKVFGQRLAKVDQEESYVPTEQELLMLIQHVEQCEHEFLSEKERTMVLAALRSSLNHYGILTSLVENSEVNDIIVRSYNDISVQKNRRNIQTDLSFPDAPSYKSFIENLLKRAGKSCTTATPVIDAAVDPHVRACVTHESFSPEGSGPMLTLRIARHQNITVDGLVQHELAPKILLEYLAAIVSNGLGTILIAGEVGSGKTTLLKALAGKIPADEAVLAIEDTHEIVLERPFMRTLLTREANSEGAGRIAPALAIRTGMRMAMNRLLLGEMRDGEAAEAFVDVCSSGHSGMSTIHARSAQDAVSRLELFLARAQRSADIETIRRQIANAVSVVVFLDVDAAVGKRRIFEIVEIGSYGDRAIQFSPMFSLKQKGLLPQWIRRAGISEFSEELRESTIELPANGSSITLEPDALLRKHIHERLR